MRFLDNHDTDRFLMMQPQNLMAFKQAIVLLLTLPGIPMIYYGTEILACGTKLKSDGYVRMDFPGGWHDDKLNCFTQEGRSKIQNEAFDFVHQLLFWRKKNLIIAQGSMVQFKPAKGIFVYERRINDDNVIVFMNGTNGPVSINLERYSEIIRGKIERIDILSKKKVVLQGDLKFTHREILILE